MRFMTCWLLCYRSETTVDIRSTVIEATLLVTLLCKEFLCCHTLHFVVHLELNWLLPGNLSSNCPAIEICGQWSQSAALFILISSLDLLLCHLQGPPHHWGWDLQFPNPKPGPVSLPATFRLECGLSALQFHGILPWWSWTQHLKLPSSPPIKCFLLTAAVSLQL